MNHSDIILFASFRTEYTGMARSESLWHVRVRMDEDEVIQEVQIKEKKNWVDGEMDLCELDPVFDEWAAFVGAEDEFEETSIPPIA